MMIKSAKWRVIGLGEISEWRKKNSKSKAGKLLIFCEGSTEWNYLNYFKLYLEHNLKTAYSSIVLEAVNAKGNAMRVYHYAEEFLLDDTNRRKYELYEKHLVFDCDAPANIEEVLEMMQTSGNEYILDYCNLLFETWLVMHFTELKPEMSNGKAKMYEAMREFLRVERYDSAEKSDIGTIKKKLSDDGNRRIRNAIGNAKCLAEYWKEQQKSISGDIKKMNPSVSIHILVERLLDEIEYLCK